MVRERLGDLVVEEGQQAVLGVDQRDLGAEVDEDRRVLAADHAGTVDRDRERVVRIAEDAVAVANARVREVQLRRTVGPRAGGDHEGIGAQRRGGALAIDRQGIGIDETCVAAEHRHLVALVEALPAGDLGVDDLVLGAQQLRVADAQVGGDLAQQRVAADRGEAVTAWRRALLGIAPQCVQPPPTSR